MSSLQRIKKNFSAAICFLILFSSASFLLAESPSVLKLRVNGAACRFCTRGLVALPKKIAGVESAKVLLSENVVVITLKPGASVDREKLIAAVRKAGYTPAGFVE